MNYRNKNDEKVIYGTTLKIRQIYPLGSLLFIAEMNNEHNIIEGIGLIKNLLVCDRRHKIYENDEYNRYIYRGKYWLSRAQIDEFNPQILEIYDNILFKKKSHLKCRIGITIITENLFDHWDYEIEILKNMVKKLFIYYFKFNNTDDTIDDNINNNIIIEETREYIEIIPSNNKKRKNNLTIQI